jgi:hypothetical protein
MSQMTHDCPAKDPESGQCESDVQARDDLESMKLWDCDHYWRGFKPLVCSLLMQK